MSNGHTDNPTYKSIEEVRAVLYPKMARLLELDEDALIAIDFEAEKVK